MITFSKLGSYGQLGNQLFQYAFLIGVGGKNQYEIRIPKKYDGEKKKDQVELEPFSISCPELTSEDQITNSFHYEDLIFNPQVFDQPDGTNFSGYFQSELYFKHMEHVVRNEFQLQFPYTAYASQFLRNFRGPYKAVAIHIRRGDYLKNPQIFWELSVNYYMQAIDLLPDVPKKFFVFSDDIEWCKSQFGCFSCHFVETPSYVHDFAVMQQCDYFVISPSSFSWWAAWLSQAPDKVVVAPDPWFVPGCKFHGKDIIPEGWIKSDTLRFHGSQQKRIQAKRRGKAIR